MNIKRVMIVGTMVVVISFGNIALSGSITSASPVARISVADNKNPGKDELLEALNQPSDKELYESLYEGKSLYDIAADQDGDIDQVIELQINQLQKQLDDRLKSGSITAKQYEAHSEELKELIAQSVLTSFG